MDRLVRTWTVPPTGDGRDRDAFAAVYADPVTLNGASVALDDLVDRYRALHGAFADLAIEVVVEWAAAEGLAVAMRQRGRHVGPLPSPAGTVEPGGSSFEVLGIDLLGVADDRVHTIWVVADELGRLAQLGAFDDRG
jgi:SnoaL-like polyketide cyclase